MRADPVALERAERAIEADEMSPDDWEALIVTIHVPSMMFVWASRLMVQWPLAMEPFQ